MYYGHYYAYSKSRSRLLRHVPSWATIILRQNVLRQKCFYARLIFYANFLRQYTPHGIPTNPNTHTNLPNRVSCQMRRNWPMIVINETTTHAMAS